MEERLIREGIWLEDPDTGEVEYFRYSEFDVAPVPKAADPVGGFLFPANEFLRLPLPRVPFYVKGILPKQGKAMIYAPAKSGKTTLAIQLGRCIAAGEPFLGLPTEAARVMYVQSEIGQRTLQDRMQMTHKSYPNMFVGSTFAMKLDNRNGQTYLIDAMTAVAPEVLILDPLYKMITGDENSATEMRVILDFLDNLIETFNCSVLIIHHAGKDATRGDRGSSTFRDWVDSQLELVKVSGSEKEGTFTVRLTPRLLRHEPLPDRGIEAEFRDWEFYVNGKTLVSTEERVAEYINNATADVTPRELFESLHASNGAIYDALNKLVAQEKILKVDRGVYRRK